MGVLNLNAINRRTFTIGQIKALTITVGMAAPSIQNAGLFEMLRDAEAKYRGIFENAVEGIFQCTREGRLIAANPSMAAILGYDSPEELMTSITDVGRQLYVDPGEYHTLVKDPEKCGAVTGFETRVYRRDGTPIWVSENIRPVRDRHGRFLHYEGSMQDITDRRKAEARLEFSAAILALLNQHEESLDLIREILSRLKAHLDIEAVGLRLQEGEDFPYYGTEGFPAAVVEAERFLSVREEKGAVVRDPEGIPSLECMCGNG